LGAKTVSKEESTEIHTTNKLSKKENKKKQTPNKKRKRKEILR